MSLMGGTEGERVPGEQDWQEAGGSDGRVGKGGHSLPK